MRPLRSLTILLLLAAAPLAAQQAKVVRDAGLRAAPEGTVVATLATGTTWRVSGARAGYTLVSVEGWIDASRLAGRRDSFPASLDQAGSLRLRADPSLDGRILGVLNPGAGLRVAERRGTWARVRRDGWVLTAALELVTAAARPASTPSRPPAPATAAGAATPAPTPPARGTAARPAAADSAGATVEPPETPAPDEALRAVRGAPLARAPGARLLGALDSGAVVEPTARDRGWVRVRVEAWVPESLLVPADPSYAARLTAADLRLDPEGFKGRTVKWEVQVIALQKADNLRRGLLPDEPYLLARGPDGENAILYLAIPGDLLETAQRLAPLTEVSITARVRNGRSQPTGAPVLDLLTLTRR
ncbi:MAG: SH3 domain-containing protein [Gemmatimonadaceae bacterium]|nr:SH3 domain-containing protein [Gemmatimonadaceae bacterium]